MNILSHNPIFILYFAYLCTLFPERDERELLPEERELPPEERELLPEER